jgi:hypothetical protein
VTDQSSPIAWSSGSISAPLAKTELEAPTEEDWRHDRAWPSWRERFRQIVCILCGRVGQLVAALIRRE